MDIQLFFDNLNIDYGLIFIKSNDSFNHISSLLTKNSWSYIGFIYSIFSTTDNKKSYIINIVNTYNGKFPLWGINNIAIEDIYNNTIDAEIEIRELKLIAEEKDNFIKIINTMYTYDIPSISDILKYYFGLIDNINTGFKIINKIISLIYNLDISNHSHINSIILPFFSISSPVKIIIPTLYINKKQHIINDIINSNRIIIKNIINTFVDLFITDIIFQRMIINNYNNKNNILIENITLYKNYLATLQQHEQSALDLTILIKIYNNICPLLKMEELPVTEEKENININITYPDINTMDKRQIEEFLHYISSLKSNKFIQLQNKLIARLLVLKTR